MKESTSMTIFDRLNIRVVAVGAGLCGVAVALSTDVAAAPVITGGYACVPTQGEAGGASPVAGVCSPGSAPLSDMAGIPMALPGPVPVVAPVPVGAAVPVVAPVPGGAPLIDMSGIHGGKGEPTGPLPDGAPIPGQPILAGPAG